MRKCMWMAIMTIGLTAWATTGCRKPTETQPEAEAPAVEAPAAPEMPEHSDADVPMDHPAH